MWIQHILHIILKYQSKTQDNYEDFLDINLDLPFAKFMIELLKPKVIFKKGLHRNMEYMGVDKHTIIGSNPVKLRYYLQKTILDEINIEFFDHTKDFDDIVMKNLHELLNIILKELDTKEKVNILLTSISDIIIHDLFE